MINPQKKSEEVYKGNKKTFPEKEKSLQNYRSLIL